jgi:hypothetical protein
MPLPKIEGFLARPCPECGEPRIARGSWFYAIHVYSCAGCGAQLSLSYEAKDRFLRGPHVELSPEQLASALEISARRRRAVARAGRPASKRHCAHPSPFLVVDPLAFSRHTLSFPGQSMLGARPVREDTAENYRRQAEVCRKQAERAPWPHKEQWLKLARTWSVMADRASPKRFAERPTRRSTPGRPHEDWTDEPHS